MQTEIKKYAENIDRISFFVGGSFFEIPYKKRCELISELNNYQNIKEVCIETRPELVTKESIKDILDCLTVENNTYTLKIEGDDLGESVDTEDFEDQLGYSIDKLEEMGLEIGIKIAMPGKLKVVQ